MKKYDRLTRQRNGKTLYERNFGKDIGTRGETIQRVVIDKYGNIVTTFPSFTFKSILFGLVSLLDPLDAISGELYDEDLDLDGNGVPDWKDEWLRNNPSDNCP